MKISLNHEYSLRNEKGCSFIICKPTLRNIKEKSLPMVMPIPPLFGEILSFFNGAEKYVIIDKIANKLNIDRDKIITFTNKIIGNVNPYITFIEGIRICLPSFLLIIDGHQPDIFTSQDFSPFDSFVPKRPSIPFYLNLMITSKCHTNCIYCYADRYRKDDMNIDVILKIIENAKMAMIPNILISGGDILATKNWKEIIKTLISAGYPQILSTKIPLKEDDIIFLKSNNINGIQISIDSFNKSELIDIIRVKNKYLDEMRNTLKYAEKYDFSINIKTVLTKYNSTIDTIQNMSIELSQYKCVKTWNIVPAFYSSHTESDYNEYRPDIKTLKTLLDYLKKQTYIFSVEFQKIESAIFTQQERYKSESEFVQKNKGCFANIYGMSIMANGKATICEMLYYNKNFYIGDANKSSIIEIWNSFRAKELNSQRINVIDKSPCNYCCELYKCKNSCLKKVCIVDIVNTYGNDKWDYPDPRCPKSLTVKMDKVIY